MALTETQQIAVSEAIGITTDVLAQQLLWYSVEMTAAREARILALVTQLDTVNNFAIEPTESNEGLRINPGMQKNEILRKIANLLFFTDLQFGSGQTVMLRG